MPVFVVLRDGGPEGLGTEGPGPGKERARRPPCSLCKGAAATE